MTIAEEPITHHDEISWSVISFLQLHTQIYGVTTLTSLRNQATLRKLLIYHVLLPQQCS